MTGSSPNARSRDVWIRWGWLIPIVLVILIAANAIVAQRALDRPDDAPVVDHVESVRDALAQQLKERAAAGRRITREALAATGQVFGRAEMFARLAELEIPTRSGVQVEDRFGRALAWAGDPLDPAAPPPLHGVSLGQDRLGSWLLVRLTRKTEASERDGPRAIAAVTRLHIAGPDSLSDVAIATDSGDSRFGRALRSRFVVGDIALLPPDATAGHAVEDVDGKVIARLTVEPASAAEWRERVESDTRRRHAALLAITLLFLVVQVFVTTIGRSPTAARWIRCAATAAVWFGLRHVEWAQVFVSSDAASTSVYSGDLGGSPLELFFTCGALATIAWIFRDPGHALAPPRGSRWARARRLLVPIVWVVGLRWALGTVADDVVANSTAEFFPSDQILPGAAAVLLFGGLLLCALATLLVLRAAWRGLGLGTPLRQGTPGDREEARLLLFLYGGALAPIVTLEPSSWWTAASALAFALAVGAMVTGRSTSLRATLVPLALSIGLLGPLESRLIESERDRVLAHVDTAASVPRDTALLRADSAIDRVLAAPELATALEQRLLTPGLAETLWNASRLDEQDAASALILHPRIGYGARQVAGTRLPPASWLPPPVGAMLPDGSAHPSETQVESVSGRSPGEDGRWARAVVGLTSGDEPAGTLEILLEWQRPALARLPALEVLASDARRASRGAPDVRLSRYDADGRLQSGSAPFAGAGALLTREQIASALARNGPVWLSDAAGAQEVGLLVQPHKQEDGRRGADVFTFATRGPRGRLLAATQAALLGSLAAGLALLLAAGRWVPLLRRRLSHQLVLLLIGVAAAPLLLLAGVSHHLILERAQSDSEAALQQAVSLAETAVRQSMAGEADAAANANASPGQGELPNDDALRRLAYTRGHHLGIYGGQDRDALIALSEPALQATQLLPPRLPGTVLRESVLLERPFVALRASRRGQTFDVGYAPLRNGEGRVIGAVAVPFPEARRARNRELAQATLTVLGFSLVTLLLAAAVGIALAGRLVAPLLALAAAARRVARGDLSERVPTAGRGELGDVVDAFNQMTVELDESQRRLVEAEKESAWRDMARQVAHEVKNPLTPMRLAAQHLQRAHEDDAQDFDNILERSVKVIVRQTEKLQRIVTDFRDFARLPRVRREPVDVGELLRVVIELYARVPELTVQVEIASDLPRVIADPEEFERVLINLVGNAVEAFEGNAGNLAARASVVATDSGERVQLQLIDDGPGIDAAALPKLFEPSFSTKTGGTGLGLAICKRAIDDLGGTITITSERRAGTTVTIQLPPHTEPS